MTLSTKSIDILSTLLKAKCRLVQLGADLPTHRCMIASLLSLIIELSAAVRCFIDSRLKINLFILLLPSISFTYLQKATTCYNQAKKPMALICYYENSYQIRLSKFRWSVQMAAFKLSHRQRRYRVFHCKSTNAL